MASTVRPRSPPGRRNRCGRRPGVLELDEHQVLGVIVDVFEGLYHILVATNATVEAGPGVFGCDEHQVLRVVVDVDVIILSSKSSAVAIGVRFHVTPQTIVAAIKI
jgi:hypothetical protein